MAVATKRGGGGSGKSDKGPTKHDVALKKTELHMMMVRCAAYVVIAGFVCTAAVIVLPDMADALAGEKTIVEFSTGVKVTFAASIFVNIALTAVSISLWRSARRSRRRGITVEAEFQSNE